MLTGTWPTWIKRPIAVRQRLGRMCTSSRLLLMVVTTQHALAEAARFSRRHPSLCSNMVQAPAKVAMTTLERLSTTPARQCAKTLARRNGLPWKIGLCLDSTRQHRASLSPENAKTFHHGQGDVSGHPWTTMVLVLGGLLMPLRPIPCSSKRDCQTHALT